MEEDKKAIAREWVSWRRILPLVIIVLVLAAAVLYYVLPSVLFPLRRDTIPEGAYVVPWMRPNTAIQTVRSMMNPWNVDVIMSGALRLDMTFSIATRSETRVVPSVIYLGHDLDYLYVGGKFQGMFTNPASDSNQTLPNYLDVLLDVRNDGNLRFPESGSRLSVLVYPDDWRTAGWYHDLVWIDYSNFYHRAIWMFGDDYYKEYLSKAQPSVAGAEATAEYDNSTGTLSILFSRHLKLAEISDIDALQMRPGERWVMGFLLELGYATWYGELTDFVRRVAKEDLSLLG